MGLLGSISDIIDPEVISSIQQAPFDIIDNTDVLSNILLSVDKCKEYLFITACFVVLIFFTIIVFKVIDIF